MEIAANHADAAATLTEHLRHVVDRSAMILVKNALAVSVCDYVRRRGSRVEQQ